MNLKECIRPWRTRISCLPWRLSAACGCYQGEGPPVRFIIENADWAIRRVGENICEAIESCEHGRIAVSTQPERLIQRVVHFGSQYMWLDWGQYMSSSNRYIASFFHGKPEDGPDVERHIDRFMSTISRLERIVTAASLVEQRLLNWGVPHSKIVRIPIGVDTTLFVPPTDLQRQRARQKYNVPDGAVVVGSFQKDGVGWGDGTVPKLIKGPDIYVQSMQIMKKAGLPVVAFLTGPARGYVTQKLSDYKIPFIHTYVNDHSDLLQCFHALDLYLLTSREEGGPMSLMESMASGVPVVSTFVGMAPDLIANGVTGSLVKGYDPYEICNNAVELIANPHLSQLRINARNAVKALDWSIIGQKHWDLAYNPLIRLS